MVGLLDFIAGFIADVVAFVLRCFYWLFMFPLGCCLIWLLIVRYWLGLFDCLGYLLVVWCVMLVLTFMAVGCWFGVDLR